MQLTQGQLRSERTTTANSKLAIAAGLVLIWKFVFLL